MTWAEEVAFALEEAELLDEVMGFDDHLNGILEEVSKEIAVVCMPVFVSDPKEYLRSILVLIYGLGMAHGDRHVLRREDL